MNPNIDRPKITIPYPASPSIKPKNKTKKIPIITVGLASLYFGNANILKRLLNPDAHLGVLI